MTGNDSLFRSSAWTRALTVAERHALLGGRGEQADIAGAREKDERSLGTRRLSKWQAQYPFNTARVFEQYLNDRGMSRESFRRAMDASPEELATASHKDPAWLTQLREAFENPQSEPFEPPEGQDDIGFLNLIDPILEQALYRLWAELERLLAEDPETPIDPQTIQDVLLMNLPDLVIQRLGRTLVLELNVLRLQDGLAGESARERFLDFIRKLRDPAFVGPLFDEYPALFRQLNICIRQWLNVSLECVGRLCADWPLLKETFADGTDPGKLVRLAGGAGDTHRRGRSVMIAEFESGLRIVYKPKSLAIDIHFQELLEWLNLAGCEPPLRSFKTLDRQEYGWAELVLRSECSSEDELQRFYRRQGEYLALLHLLASTDFHFENVIAAGEHPMLIDLETMLQPLFERYDETDGEAHAMRHMAESVLSIGLLPMRIWSYGDDYQGIDISGLGGASGQLSPDRIPSIAELGTDAMHYVRERVEIEGDANRPTLDGVEANAIDFIDDIVSGFEGMYRLVMQHQDELLRPGGPIDAFADDSIRVLMRPTRTYAQLLYESFHPDMLRDQVDRDLFLDRLWVVVAERTYMKEIIAAEQEDLLSGDIPVFTSTPSSLNLFDAMERPIPGVLTVRGIENVRRRIRAMSDADLQRQAWYIRASIATVAPDKVGPAPTSAPQITPTFRVSSSRLTDCARAAADYLCDIVHEGREDAVWVGLQGQGERHWAISTLGLDLYGGAPGIALFLAHAGEVLQQSRYTDLARKAYGTIRAQSDFAADDWSALGGYEGWGGILQLFTRLGVLWEDEEVLAQADRVANRIWGYVEETTLYDVVRGAAGATLSLLGLHSVRPSPAKMQIALMGGRRLLDAAEPQNEGIGWPATRFGDGALIGYAHGAAGIATALTGLFRTSGEIEYRFAAEDAVKYERSLFDVGSGGWPDRRPIAGYDRPLPYDDADHYAGWCRGAAGIGLSRLQMLGTLDDGGISQEIDAAVAVTMAHGFGHSHCLCHGDLGNLEFLHQASSIAEWSALQRDTNRWTNAVLDSIAAQGWKCGGPDGVLMPGLMLGVAGIGYQLLRLAEPDVVPSVLTPWPHLELGATEELRRTRAEGFQQRFSLVSQGRRSGRYTRYEPTD